MKKERPQTHLKNVACGTTSERKGRSIVTLRLQNLYAALLLLLLFCTTTHLQAQVVLATEDFDGGGVGYTTTSEFTTNANSHFNDTDGTNISNVSGPYSFQGGGNIFWAAENVDDTGSGGNGDDEQRLATNSFPITGYGNIMVCIDMAAGNEQLGNLGTYDQSDYVQVQYNTDIQPLYIDAINFAWLPNAFDPTDLFNQPLHHDPNKNGDGSDGVQITTTAQNFCFTIPNANTIDVNAATMSIRVIVHVNANSEEIAFDNIVVTGSDVEPPTVTCPEFTMSFSGCPDLIGSNTPDGIWVLLPASGTIQTSIGGSYTTTIDVSGCVTDNFSPITGIQRRLFASYEENRVPGCSVDIINEYEFRDAAGNISPDHVFYRGTVTFDGPPPAIICPANITVECGDSTDPMDTGMATATSGCGTPTLTFVDVVAGNGCSANTGNINRTWTATDGCGQVSQCTQVITVEDNIAPIMVCNTIDVQLVGGMYTLTQADVDAIAAGTTDACTGSTTSAIQPNTFTIADVGANMVTHTAIDACGNAATCQAIVNVICPLVVDCSNITDQNLECRSDLPPVDFNLPIITASCGDFTLSALTIIPGNNGCPGNAVIIPRTYFIQDDAGNMAECMQTFTVESTIPPTIVCPANVVLDCTDDTSPANTGMATGTASCLNFTLDITSSDVSTQGMAGCSQYQYTITRTWFATDACGRVTSCDQIIEVEDNTAPTIDCPANATIECDESTAPANTGMAAATDNCSTGADLVITFSDVSTQGMGCGEFSYIIIRTWTATDACGNANAATCSQTITVEDSTAPTIDCPANATIECDESTAPANTGMAAATDNCSTGADLVITFSDVSTQGMGCGEFSYIIIRTWTATDVCGNAATCSQTITVEDNNPPTITCPANVTVECDQPTTPATTGTATATGDNCAADAQLTITFTDVSTQTPTGCGNDSYTITRTWTATDPCGNAVTCDQVITIVDTTPPTIVCPANTTIECDESTAPANTGTAVAIDACAPAAELTITFADASTQATSGCGQYQYVITRTWTATDPCGNASTCAQIITVEDTTPPAIVCPANVSLSCTDNTSPANNGIATGSDNCSTVAEVVITSSDISTQGTEGCSKFTYQIFRTWLATDACGNTTTCVQNIAVADTEAPVITCPPSQTLTCFETVPTPFTNAADFIAGGGTISDNCTSLLTDFTVFVQNDDNGGDNCPGNSRTVVRTYFVSDACGNISTCTQTFTYLASTQGPVITSVLPTCYKYCEDLLNPMEADITYTTDCSFGATVTVAGPTQIGAANCPGTIYRFTYTVTDDCGRTSAPVTRDFIIGNDGPTIQCPPFNLLLECGDPNNSDYIAAHIGTVTANTSCGLGVTINHFPTNFNNITCNTGTVVTFVATDACGRTASCTTTINISDNTAPVITSTYIDGVCNEGICGSNLNFWYNEWKAKVLEGLSATDECDSNVTFTVVGPNSPNQNCPDGTAETEVTWVANDNCGNTSEISYSFYVVPANDPVPAPSIMGMIATEETETVESVTVTLTGNNSTTNVSLTEEDGLYGFENLVLDNNYTVTPYSNEDPLNGVTSYDLVLISKHILQLQALDSPYKMIAADVNNSGNITTMDLVELRKLILHIDEEFANNTSWRFVEADYVFPQPNNPFATTFPEVVFINGLTAEEQHDFVGVKIGDVNGTAVANSLVGSEDRSFQGELNFGIKNLEMEAGETYEVAFRANDFINMMGYQYTLNFDATQVEFAGIETGSLPNMSESNFGLSKLNEGIITTSWTNDKAISLMDDAVLFTLRFTAKANTLLSEVISISSRYTAAEAYRNVDTANGVEFQQVALRFDTEEFGGAKFSLHQNIPNPFTDETMIGFNLPENTTATITIYDMSGRALTQIEGEYTKGYHTVSITQDELKGSAGILYYELATPTQRLTKKMTLIGK